MCSRAARSPCTAAARNWPTTSKCRQLISASDGLFRSRIIDPAISTALMLLDDGVARGFVGKRVGIVVGARCRRPADHLARVASPPGHAFVIRGSPDDDAPSFLGADRAGDKTDEIIVG